MYTDLQTRFAPEVISAARKNEVLNSFPVVISISQPPENEANEPQSERSKIPVRG